jgi:hypothetical protein
MSAEMRLDRASVEAIAQRVAELLDSRISAGIERLRTAAEIAAELGTTPAWVRENAEALGALRLGNGSKAPLRFDPQVVQRRLEHRGVEVADQGRRDARRRRPPARRIPKPGRRVPLLPGKEKDG